MSVVSCLRKRHSRRCVLILSTDSNVQGIHLVKLVQPTSARGSADHNELHYRGK